MSKELALSSVVTSLGDVAQMDFSKVFDKAIEVFSSQAMLDKPASEVTIKDLEISKAKANNFLDAIAGIIEISHQVEVLSAEKEKFRRQDELDILNSLRRTIAIQSKALEKNAHIAAQQLEHISSQMEDAESALAVDSERLALIQSVLNSSIDIGSKLISSAAKLIHLERHSGGRVWGNNRYAAGNIRLIDGLDKADKTKGKPGAMRGLDGGPRELSMEDIEGLEDD